MYKIADKISNIWHIKCCLIMRETSHGLEIKLKVGIWCWRIKMRVDNRLCSSTVVFESILATEFLVERLRTQPATCLGRFQSRLVWIGRMRRDGIAQTAVSSTCRIARVYIVVSATVRHVVRVVLWPAATTSECPILIQIWACKLKFKLNTSC